MPASRTNFFDHLRWFRAACRSAGAEAIVSLESWQAFVRDGDRHVVFHPQFQGLVNGRLQYQPALTADSTMFAGWMPYRLKRWETAVDKLAFKRYAKSVGISVPGHWLNQADVPADASVVVKSPRSSFSMQVDGPFRSAAERPLDIAQGEYYERFLEGRVLKTWYWNGEAVCAELDRWPLVWGDGVRTLEELTLARATRHRPIDDPARERLLERTEKLFRYYGRALDQVLAKGQRQAVDFRYGSSLMLSADRTVVDFATDERPAWLDQVQHAGRKLHEAIPAEIRAHTVFTVDAMLLRDDQVRFLEVNCNPTVHPLVYPRMLLDLFRSPAPADAAVIH